MSEHYRFSAAVVLLYQYFCCLAEHPQTHTSTRTCARTRTRTRMHAHTHEHTHRHLFIDVDHEKNTAVDNSLCGWHVYRIKMLSMKCYVLEIT